MRWLCAVALGLWLLAAGCGGSDAREGANSDDAALENMLAFAPARTGDDYRIAYTNWRAIARAMDLDVDTAEQATDLLVRVGEQGAPFAAQVPSKLWHQSDVVWEGQVGPAGAPVFAVALRDGVEFDRIVDTLDGCGLAASARREATVFDGSLRDMARCAGRFGTDVPLFGHIAVLPDRGVVLMAQDADQLNSALESDGDVASDDDVVGLADALGSAQSLVLDLGDACRSGIAAGLVYGAEDGAGRIALRYPDADTAKKDAAARERALSEGRSAMAHRPYSDVLDVYDVKVDDDTVVLSVHPPVKGLPLPLNEMYQQRDLAFAGC